MKPPRLNSYRLRRVTLVVVVLLLICGLRLVALRSDPFPKLDWSAGLMNDEGFNIHNARNLILFGHISTDEYNNMLFSPLYHFAQVGVFKVIGVGSVQARMISVVCSLLTLLFLWAALKRAFDHRIAFTGVLFLGLDHTNLLFNRMALMDTPAALFSVMAFYAFVLATTARTETTATTERNRRWIWLLACGALLAVGVTVRTVGIYLLFVPFVALTLQMLARSVDKSGSGPERLFYWREFILIGVAAFVVFALYLLLWYWPHYAELIAMSHYYRARQIPKSVPLLLANFYNATLGPRGLSTYLFHHTPVVFTFTLLGLSVTRETRSRPIETYLIAWFVFGCGLLAVSSYSPSRYYVTVYPAMAALAAISVWRLQDLWTRFQAADVPTRIFRAVLIWFLVYHVLEIFLQHYGIQSRSWASVFLFGVPALLVVLIFRLSIWNPSTKGFNSQTLTAKPGLATAIIALWFVFNAYWLGAWLFRLDYTQYQMSQWLAQNVPAGSVLIGDVAPGVCLDNNFIAVYVEPRLWNDVMPVEKMGVRYPGAARYIIMDDRWKYRYWMLQYPELVTPERRVKLARVLNWEVGVYAVKP